MNSRCRTIILLGVLMGTTGIGNAGTVDDALADYRIQGAAVFAAQEGARLWNEGAPAADGSVRRCTDCHGASLTQGGRHVRTDEAIEPMAPSVNPKRLTDRRQIEKWFLRNCKWTFGRECSAQEKGDILSYLRGQ